MRCSYATQKLTLFLGDYIGTNDSGALFGDDGLILGKRHVCRSNLIYFAKKRLHLVGEKAMEGPPDLCVEIISPSSSKTDRKAKFKQYEAGKVAHYWIVDPSELTIEGYKLVAGRYRATGSGSGDEKVSLPPFADLEIPLRELWWRR